MEVFRSLSNFRKSKPALKINLLELGHLISKQSQKTSSNNNLGHENKGNQ